MISSEILSALTALPNHKTATVRALRQEMSKRIKEWTAHEVLALADRLLDEPDDSARFIAMELVAFHRGALRALDRHWLERIGRVLDSWWSVDTFASYLSGVAWRNGQIPDAVVQSWARSSDRWWRRAALVSTIPLNTRARGGKGDVPRTLAVCELLAADHDDMVEKALSWALRELLPFDPGTVSGFIEKHRGVLGKRIIREVKNKQTTGLKTPRGGVTP